jgi:ribonuclease P protein subunit POP4
LSSQKASNLLQHELIGLKVEIINDSNPYNIKLRGYVIDESRNSLMIKNVKKQRIAKKNAVFKFILDGESVKVEGRILIGRPEDRVKKQTRRKW